MTTICLNEDSATSASWLHRLRKSTSCPATGTAAVSADNESSAKLMVVNSKEINSRRFKIATTEIDGKVPDESTDGDAEADSPPLHRLAVSLDSDEPRTRGRFASNPPLEEDIAAAGLFEQHQTSHSKLWRQMRRSSGKVDLPAELCRLTGTIRVKIDRKNRSATLISGHLESVGRHAAPKPLASDKPQHRQQSKSTTIQSAANDAGALPEPKDTRTLPLTVPSEFAMAESIVLSQSAASSSHQSASPFGKSYAAYSSPKSASSHHSSILSADETSSSSKHSLSLRTSMASPSASALISSTSRSASPSSSIGKRSPSETFSSSASASRTQPHDNDSISHTAAVSHEDDARSEDNCRAEESPNSPCSRPIEDNEQTRVNNGDLKDKSTADRQPRNEQAKTSVIVSSAAVLQSITSKRLDTDSRSISPSVPPQMNNTVNGDPTAHCTGESPAASHVKSPSASSSTLSPHSPLCTNQTNDLEQSRSSNCADDGEDDEGDSRTECSDKQSIGDNNDNNETGDHRTTHGAPSSPMEEDDNDTEVSELEPMVNGGERRLEMEEEEDEDDRRGDDFDPTEVLKRMKVELKEEFDEEEDAADNEAMNGQKQMMAMMAGQQRAQQQHNQQRKNHEHNGGKNNFMPGLFGGAAGGFDQSATIEYFRKIFAGTLASHFNGAPELMDVEPVQRRSPANQSQSPQSQLAAFTAAAAALAAAHGSNGSAAPTSVDSLILDESKKRLIQAILLKQLNGDLDGSLDVQSLLGQSTPPQTTSGPVKGGPMSQPQPQQPQQSMHHLSPDDPQQRYCTSCNIQFISAKTFKVHKELYCSGRHQNSNATCATNNSSTASTSAMTCGTSHDIHPRHGASHRKGSGHHHHQQQQQQAAMAAAQMQHNLSPPPMSITSTGSSNGSPSLSHTSAASSRKRSTSSWPAADAQKEADFSSFLPNMMFPNGLAGLNNENFSFPLNPSMAPSSSEPIYIAISTNPLILLPFVFNSATNSLVPMANGASSANFGVGKSSAPIIFPNGMPSLSSSGDQSTSLPPHSLSSPSPSNHSSSNSSSASTNRQHSSNSSNSLPFITTFSNLTQHLMNSGSSQGMPASPQTSPHSQHQTTSALINSLINSELNSEAKSAKKRRHSNDDHEETDQPLDLSSGSAPSMPSKSKRAREDPFAAFSIKKEHSQTQEGLSDNLNNFLQKFAQMHQSAASDPLASSSLLFPGLTGQSAAAAVGFADQLASINAMARENPTFAQYLAVAMAALNGGNNAATGPNAPMAPGSGPSVVPAVSPQVDVVVKQGNSRCVECNIVFYKHENYLVHKELYCASRRTSGSQDGAPVPSQSSPVPSGVSTNAPLSIARPTSAHSSASSAASPSMLSPSSKYGAALRSPKTTADELTMSTSPGLLQARDSASISPRASMSSPKPSSAAAAAIFQYYCAACGIKFTSYDNLQAHQTYYCLKRSSTAVASPNQAPIQSTSPIAASNVGSSPATPMLTPQQILAAAASLQGTEGLDFSSPAALSQHLALITAAATAAVAGANQAAAASAGKSPLGHAPVLGDFHCAKCKATYVSAETLAAHVCSADLRPQPEKAEPKSNTTSSTSSIQASSLQRFCCTICGYKGHTMRGMRTHVRVHSEQLAATGAYEEEFIVQNTDPPEPSLGRGRGAHLHSSLARQRRRSSNLDNDGPHHSQLEQQQRKMKHEHEQMIQQAKSNSLSHLSPDGLVAQTHTCQFCRYTSNYKGNVIRHIKLVHKDIASAQLAATMALQQQALAKELQGSMSGLGEGTASSAGDFASTTSGGDLDNNTDSVSVKCEESSKSPIRLTNGSGSKEECEETTTTTTGDNDLDTRHCSSCNISFTYRNSYLAHKKYYCSSHTSEA